MNPMLNIFFIISKMRNTIIIIMLQSIKIAVQCQFPQKFHMEVFAEMNMAELSEFLLNSDILHKPLDSPYIMTPLGVRSTNRNLLIDYMLMSSQITVKDVYTTYKYLNAKLSHSSCYLKQSEFEKNENYDKEETLTIAINYQNTQILGKNEENVRLMYCYINDIDEKLENSVIKFPERLFDFKDLISLNKQTPIFILSKQINKCDLNSFQKLQKLLQIKKKLIQYKRDHLHLFGQLDEIIQMQDSIAFRFKYVPTISFSDIMHFQFSLHTVEYFVNKIWVFLMYLKRNNYQSYIYRLYKKRSLKLLLDQLSLCINHRLIITDLNILLEEGGNDKFTESQQENLVEEIKIYVKLNKSHLSKYEDRLEVEPSKSINLMSLFTFSKIFFTKKYQFVELQRNEYKPQTKILTWRQDQSSPENEKQKDINEATTAKKPRNPTLIEIKKKTKKNRQLSPNCSFAYASIKKSKLKRHK